jgi:hypothetical protein
MLDFVWVAQLVNIFGYLNVWPYPMLCAIRLMPFSYILRGRAIAQAVSRWLPTAAARVQNRV